MGDHQIGLSARPDAAARAAGRDTRLALLVSEGTDPAANLALEDDLLGEVDAGTRGETVRLWVNDACLVQGRRRSGTSGWHRPDRAAALGISVHVRSTGGGTVYHDRGNLNWSFYLRRSAGYVGAARLFRGCAGFIAAALQPEGFTATFAAPNRIDVDGRKVSGLAARAGLEAVLVHGTLLVSSDLDRLNALCIYPPGCPPVVNLGQLRPGYAVADATAAIARHAASNPPPLP